MKFTLPTEFVEEIAKSTKSSELRAMIETSRFKKKVEMESTDLPKAVVKAMVKAAREEDYRFTQVIEAVWATMKGGKGKTFGKIADMYDALRGLIFKSAKKTLYTKTADGIFQPWLVSGISYIEQSKSLSVRFTSLNPITGKNEVRYEDWDMHWLRRYIRDLFETDEEYEEAIASKDYKVTTRMKTMNKGKEDEYQIEELLNVEVLNVEKYIPLDKALEDKELYLETEELNEIYAGYLKRFFKFLPMYGKQFKVRGTVVQSQGWYGAKETSMTTDGQPGRCIMTTIPAACTITNEEEEIHHHQWGYRRRIRSDGEETSYLRDQKTLDIAVAALTESDFVKTIKIRNEGMPEEDGTVPINPKLMIYHLEKHEVFEVHVSNLGIYKYRENIGDMLVLPESMREQCEMLVSTDDEDSEDVIENKSKATIIAAVGDPGLGKTLMAEVLSEQAKRPLYKVQAAQLGLTSNELEENLKDILRKAETWGCILLIDEANAYIHERGYDIKQNAVVGVFLRMLEYFKGTMILTTNHAGPNGEIDIDDAIISRCSAVIPFHLPTPEASKKIWEIQAKLIKAKLSKELIKHLVETYRLSGRSIRQLLRLANRLATKRGVALDEKIFETCNQYVSVTKSERQARDLKKKAENDDDDPEVDGDEDDEAED